METFTALQPKYGHWFIFEHTFVFPIATKHGINPVHFDIVETAAVGIGHLRNAPRQPADRGARVGFDSLIFACITRSWTASSVEKQCLAIRYYIRQIVMEAAFMDSAITSKGQATIPKAVREHLGLRPGDRVKFFMHPDGSVVLLPKVPAMALRGMVRRPRRRVSIAMMDAAVAAEAAGEGRRRKRR